MSSPENSCAVWRPSDRAALDLGRERGHGHGVLHELSRLVHVDSRDHQPNFLFARPSTKHARLAGRIQPCPRRAGAGKTRRAKARNVMLSATLTDEFA